MKISSGIAAGITLAALMASCVNNEKVVLSVDFSTRPSWDYDFSASVGGRVVMGDSVSAFSHVLGCRLSGKSEPANPFILAVTAGNVSLESSMFDEAEKQNVVEMLDGYQLTFSLREGFASFDDSVPLPVVRAGQWDLYRHFAKMIPVLPEGKIRPGFTWERHRQIPLPTTQGDAVGHLYQSFRFDSLTAGSTGRLACVSWKFSYTVEVGNADTAGIINDMPHKGHGTGAALIGVDEKSLREAGVEFVIPQGSASDPFSIEWKESASIKVH
jgi:hypothetical protein